MDITVHIYNKPRNKKSSKLLIQCGDQFMICMFVFNVLPRIYKNVCKNTEKVAEIKKKQSTKSEVSCGQCKVKATLTDMKMHLKTAHSKPSTKKPSKPSDSEANSNIFKFDNCGYKTMDRKILMQHIDAIHLIPWNIRMEQNKNDIKCNKCDFV